MIMSILESNMEIYRNGKPITITITITITAASTQSNLPLDFIISSYLNSGTEISLTQKEQLQALNILTEEI